MLQVLVEVIEWRRLVEKLTINAVEMMIPVPKCLAMKKMFPHHPVFLPKFAAESNPSMSICSDLRIQLEMRGIITARPDVTSTMKTAPI